MLPAWKVDEYGSHSHADRFLGLSYSNLCFLERFKVEQIQCLNPNSSFVFKERLSGPGVCGERLFAVIPHLGGRDRKNTANNFKLVCSALQVGA